METLTTSDPGKLPEAVRGLLDETRPLPAGVAFFEQRFTAGALVRRIAIAAVLLLIAAFLFLSSLEFLWEHGVDPKYRHYFNVKEFVASAAFAYGGWLMLASLGEGRALARRQAGGARTRHGIFLLTDALVSRSQFDTTVIPREQFRGLADGKVSYLVANAPNAPKSFTLPGDWIGTTPTAVAQAIHAWQTTSPVPPPPSSPSV